ncbi:TetR family transcriptional regulator [Mycobacterium leprae Kyoto-2]|uniref:TetR-family transcriptional regulator n=3 Tax=Mycobacterium leprae TaxID=1769 RepID=Q7APS2_MYCLE|nr:TetR/AcrR family transcriptional regulator [Mycobacterium leprae]OAR21088.1 TetR family transcriptional regulator [Mycobacterium leprae 3125609]OAX71258.1 TetR family transcriptional regulator [Mycobacterium leprae 7935681]CAR72777.1 putative TetR-family transcriptional regulator [Mycobacterium leprae Br4923]BBC17869.1 TetR family transcriptional regulator [Mycobacterium leprae Kyoto-2]
MESQRRTQEERSTATRDALTLARHRLWRLRGYAEVGTPEIAKEADTTRGAVYHQFTDKAALFRDVVETVEQDAMAQIASVVASSGAKTPVDAIRAKVDAWLEGLADPQVRQLILLYAPSVLGWAAFRDVAQHYSLGMTEQQLLSEASRARQLAQPLDHVLIGKLYESAMAIRRHHRLPEASPARNQTGAAPTHREHVARPSCEALTRHIRHRSTRTRSHRGKRGELLPRAATSSLL